MPGNSALQGPKQRLFTAVIGISVVIILALGIDLSDSRRLDIEKARSVSDNISRLLSERLDGSVREVDYVLRDLADRLLSMPAAEGARPSAELDGLLAAKLSTLPQASSLSILDRLGKILASSRAGAARGGSTSASLDAEVGLVGAFAAEGGLDSSTRAVFGAAYEGGATLERARAVRGRDGGLVAVVVARIDVSVIQAELVDIELGEHRIIAVTDPGLRVVARMPEAPEAVGSEMSDPAARGLLRRLKEAGPGVSSMRSEDGPASYTARVGKYAFFAIIGEADAEIMAEWNKRLASYGIALTVIVALLVALARLMIRNFARSSELAARLVAMESASDMIVIADLDGKAEYVNPSFERTTGIGRLEAIGSRRAIFGLDEADAEVALAAAASGESWRGEVAVTRPEGPDLIEEVSVAPVLGPGGEPVRIVAVLRDVTERRRLQERLERLAHYDPLTALPNRVLFFDRLEGAVARARREERRFALLFIDLDGFKAVNDSYGHDAGDYLLFEIARRLKGAIRDSDTAGRMGGDEFTVLLENISKAEDAMAVAVKIRSALVEPIAIPAGAQVSVGASIGIAVYPDDGADGESVLKAADSAMYATKLASGDRR